MNANYIYAIFETTEKQDAPDMTVGLAMLEKDKPVPDGMTPKAIREFIGKHYDELVRAYKHHDRQIFADAVAACVADDEAAE